MTSYEDQGAGYDPHASGHELQGRRSLTEAPEAEAVEPVAGGVLDFIGASGRKPTISKHRAVSHIHLRDTITSLDARGLRAEADTLVWLVWWRALDWQREEFLIDDAQVKAASLQADLDRAIEALRPFAKAMAEWCDDDREADGCNCWEHPLAMNVTVGDFRRAAAVFSTGETKPDDAREFWAKLILDAFVEGNETWDQVADTMRLRAFFAADAVLKTLATITKGQKP